MFLQNSVANNSSEIPFFAQAKIDEKMKLAESKPFPTLVPAILIR
jgi:hypothetical protein